MRYILDNNGYIEEIIFGGTIVCNNNSCTEYIGNVPTGYSSLMEWADNANIRAYTIIDNNLVYDSAKDIELKELWATEKANNTPEIKGNKTTSIDVTSTDEQYPSAKAVYDSIQEIDTKSTVLWSQTLEEITAASTFENQNIALDLTPYKFVAISFYKNYTNTSSAALTQIFKVGTVEKLNKSELFSVDYYNGPRAWIREINVKHNGIYFYQGALNGATNNKYLVPFEIVGIK